MFDEGVSTNLLQLGLIKQQLSRLDLDLAIQLALSGVSLDPTFIYRTLQLTSHVQMLRLVTNGEGISAKQKEEFEILSHELVPKLLSEKALTC